MNDAVKFLIGQELHESEEALQLGLQIVAHMYLRRKKLSVKHNMKFTLEESPAESAARRLAKTDLVYFRDEALRDRQGRQRGRRPTTPTACTSPPTRRSRWSSASASRPSSTA